MIVSSPKISVIVAVFNGVEYIRQCIESIATQTYKACELIIIDGGSTDGTVDILRSCERDITQWLSETDRGISDAWNKGVARATGDWFCFLGADDCLASTNALSDAAARLGELVPQHRIVYGDVIHVDMNGNVIERSGSSWDAHKFKGRGMRFSHQGVFHHRSLFYEVGSFDISYRLAGDYEWLLRAILRTEPFYLSGLSVTVAQTGGRAADDANGLLVLSEYARAQRQHLGRIIPWRLGWTALKTLTKLMLMKMMRESCTHRIIDMYRVLSGRPLRWEKTVSRKPNCTTKPRVADKH